MNLKILCLSALLFHVLLAQAESSVVVDVTLSPAGSYKATTSKISGSAYKTSDGGVAAENVVVDMKSLKTGISLRDKHTKERLKVKEFPQAKLISASGKGGKGKALVEIKGIKKEVTGTYKVEGSNLMAAFDINLADLDIKDVKYMGIGVKDKVTVHVNIPLSAKGK